MSTKFVRLFAALAAVMALVAVQVAANDVEEKEEAETEHQYVGAKKCKICHKPQYKSWLETKHAKTFEVLSDEEKKKPECLACHTTGSTADGVLIQGAECEACHGPGSDYKSPKIKSKKKWKADRETQKQAAIEAGLIYPVEEDCTRCHRKEGNINFKEFDFAKSFNTVHELSEATIARLKEPKKEVKEE